MKNLLFRCCFSVGSIIGLFSRLLNTKSCTKLNTSNSTFNSLYWKLTSNSLRIPLELNFENNPNSVLQNHFIGNKANEINKMFLVVF